MPSLHALVSRALAELSWVRSERLLVAVSGGADSVALLHLLLGLGQSVAVGHVHHGLRDEADVDEAFVASLAARVGVPHASLRVDAAKRDGRSPEARARALRYAALTQLAAQLGCDAVATAHTLDDQAETVLLRQLRGTGLDGLAAIAPRLENPPVVRPLLRARRGELRAYLEARELPWREDPSNRELAIPRNRLRAQVLPVLEEIHPGALERLAELADRAREAVEARQEEVDAAVAQASRDEEGGLRIDAGALTGLSATLRGAVLRALLRRAGLGERISRQHVGRSERFLIEAHRGMALSLPGDRALVRRDAGFWLGPAGRSRAAPRAADGSRSPSERSGGA
jgi:tRNA(Ile)-lysidine synthase